MGLESLEQHKKDLIKLANLKFKVAIFLMGVLILFAPPGDFSTFSIRHTINRKTPPHLWGVQVYTIPPHLWGVQVYTIPPHLWGVQAYTILTCSSVHCPSKYCAKLFSK